MASCGRDLQQPQAVGKTGVMGGEHLPPSFEQETVAHKHGEHHTLLGSKTGSETGHLGHQSQKNPHVRKIRVRNSGTGNGCANFMDA